MTDESVTAEKTKTYVVIGQHYWGSGPTVEQAKKLFREQGGHLSKGYSLLTFTEDMEFKGVDQMGAIHWIGTGDPERQDVAPRGR